MIGSPSSVAGAVAASTAAAAAAAAAAVSAAVAAGVVVDPGRVIGSGSSAERLEQLKKEKRVLHVMLKNFEKEFKEKNGREVSRWRLERPTHGCVWRVCSMIPILLPYSTLLYPNFWNTFSCP